MSSRIPILIALFFAVSAAGCHTADLTYVRDLPTHVGQPVTVQGRAGSIKSRPGASELIFTLRDKYDGYVDVHASPKPEPIMGMTYDIMGIPKDDPSPLYLDAQSISPSHPSYGPEALGLAILLLVAGIVYAYIRPTHGIWTTVHVASGPDINKEFQLRQKRTVVGKGPGAEVSLDKDKSVSRSHGLIIRRGKAVFFRDTQSRYGTQVGGRTVKSGTDVRVPPGTFIQLGPNTTIVIGGPEGDTKLDGVTTGTLDSPKPPDPHRTIPAVPVEKHSPPPPAPRPAGTHPTAAPAAGSPPEPPPHHTQPTAEGSPPTRPTAGGSPPTRPTAGDGPETAPTGGKGPGPGTRYTQ